MQARIVLCVVLAATVLVYWTGLSGPLLYDDGSNLAPVLRWLYGDASWQEAVFGNHSGMFGRPIPMATFLLSAWQGNYDPFWFKLGNLVVHLLCGLIGWRLLQRLLSQDETLSRDAAPIAVVVVALWLLHPLNASTVLYIVQRMAQLSTLFVLAALWAYACARRKLIAGETKPALAGLFVLFPLLLGAGLLSKENAAVGPALCLVLELAYFQPRDPRRPAVRIFFTLFLLLPALAGLAWFLMEPNRLLGGYANRDFTLWQRVLTQPRALLDYIGLLVFPRGPLMGLYTDDFRASTGLLSPPSTLVASLVLVGLSAGAVALRKRAPSVFAGWFFFLVAHAVESSFLPLDLYYEHRNYLPAFGLLLAVVAFAVWIGRRVPTNVLSPRQLGLLVAGGFAVTFAFSTLGRAKVWQHKITIAEQGVARHPRSMRAHADLANELLRAGEATQAIAAMAPMTNSDLPRERLLAHLGMATLGCMGGVGANPADLQSAVADAQPRLSKFEPQTISALAGASLDGGCRQVSGAMIADTIVQLLAAASTQPDTDLPKWQLRFYAADLYAHAGRWDDALPQARLAWQPGANAGVGALLARIYLHQGERPDAERTVAEIAARVQPRDSIDQAELAKIRAELGRGGAKAPMH